MRLAQDILENYIGVEEDEEDAAGESRRQPFMACYLSCVPLL
jgi:hypothetical protein